MSPRLRDFRVLRPEVTALSFGLERHYQKEISMLPDGIAAAEVRTKVLAEVGVANVIAAAHG